MVFKDLYNLISRKLKINNDNDVEDIKDVINDQIKEFCRLREWANIWKTDTFQLDGSNSYALDSILINRCTIKDVYIVGSDPLQKTDYKIYRRLPSTSGFYSILGNNIYIEGTTGDYEILYTYFGGDGNTVATDVFPLEGADDEIDVTKHYWSIIAQMVKVYMLEEWGDVGTIQLETNRLSRKILTLKAQENRQENNGKRINFART